VDTLESRITQGFTTIVLEPDAGLRKARAAIKALPRAGPVPCARRIVVRPQGIAGFVIGAKVPLFACPLPGVEFSGYILPVATGDAISDDMT